MAQPDGLKTRKLYDFMSAEKFCVISTISPDGRPEAALVGFAVTPELEVIFETTDATRKCPNLRRDPRIALVIGWNDQRTLQYEGIVDEPMGSELERLKTTFFSAWPQVQNHEGWPGLTYFRVKPRWIRFSSYFRPRSVDEISFDVERKALRSDKGSSLNLHDKILGAMSHWIAKRS